MTAPVPGFPPELETAITEALRGHYAVYHTEIRSYVCDACGASMTYDGHEHRAAVVMEVIAQHTTTEWGRSRPVGFKSTRRYVSPTSHRPASVEWDEILVARLVLPWQEVKA